MQGFGVAIYMLSTNLVYQRGTVTCFKNPARHMYKRWRQAIRLDETTDYIDYYSSPWTN